MRLFRRSPGLPADVRERFDLPRGDRELAVGELVDGWALATTRGLHVARGGDVLERAWSDVDGARLDPEQNLLTITWVDGTRPTALRLADDRQAALPRAVHDRVQSSVVHTERVELSRGRTVRVALRRTPDGTLVTQVLGTGDVDLSDPTTAAAVDAAEARVREAAGLP